jgi:hypothetical protein
MALHGAIHEREQLHNQAGFLSPKHGTPRASHQEPMERARHVTRAD